MSLLGSLFGKTGRSEKRRHTRVSGNGVRVQIDRQTYRVHDLSLGGFRLYPYDGDLIVKQHFQFSFILVVDGEPYEIPGRGSVTRIDETGLAATYERPQPYFREILARYIDGPGDG